MSLQIFQPAFCGLIIMCTCINYTVVIIFVWKIAAIFTSIKRKLKHFHSQISALFQHFQNTFCQETKIFCDHSEVFDFFIKCMEQIHSRTLFPFSPLSSLVPIRNSIILIKSTEMIDSDYIIKFQAVCHSLHPPAITVFLKCLPVIQWISPQLSGC